MVSQLLETKMYRGGLKKNHLGPIEDKYSNRIKNKSKRYQAIVLPLREVGILSWLHEEFLPS